MTIEVHKRPGEDWEVYATTGIRLTQIATYSRKRKAFACARSLSHEGSKITVIHTRTIQ